MADLRRGKAVSRRCRNRRIGEFLKELDVTEGRETGIPKILRAMRANGSPSPKFETDADRTSFLIRLMVRPPAKLVKAPEVAPQVAQRLRACAGQLSRGGIAAEARAAGTHGIDVNQSSIMSAIIPIGISDPIAHDPIAQNTSRSLLFQHRRCDRE